MERQWRARGAGLRTNALVATGAALFVLLSAYGFDAGLVGGVRVADPTRVAAQIVSGIGFLGAGVILRDGLNVRGLNTAATLWCAAAVGALAGAGMYRIALLGTAAVIIANVVLRPLGHRPAVTAVTWTVRTDPDSTTDDPLDDATTTHTAAKSWRLRSPVTRNDTR